MKIENGEKIKLCTFSGTSTSEKPTRPSENYWKLIGQTGTVIVQEGEAGLLKHKLGTRVLVEFSTSIPELGLSYHNEAPNSLWILVADLIIIPES